MPLPDISIHKFSRIASGSYNAGFVDFRTDDNGNVIPVPDYEQEPDDTMCPRCEVLLKSTAFGDTSKLDAPVFEPNGKYSTQVFNRLGNAESPIVKAEKLVETLVRHADTEHEQFYHDHAQIAQEALEKLGTYLQNAGDSADQKASAFCAFVNSFTDAESSPLQNVFFYYTLAEFAKASGTMASPYAIKPTKSSTRNSASTSTSSSMPSRLTHRRLAATRTSQLTSASEPHQIP